MPTIKEVAKVAGVSVGTVSHVINSAVPVSEKLRAKVDAAIKALDYHPNYIARSLKTQESHTIGIVIPDMTIAFFPRVVKGAESALRQNGYSLLTITTDDDVERQHMAFSLLRSERVDGILLVMASGRGSVRHIQHIKASGMPLVCLDRIPSGITLDSVCTDSFTASQAAVDHLVAMGYRRIAILTGRLTLQNEQQRLRGYKRSLEKAGIPYERNLVWVGSFNEAQGMQVCPNVWRRLPRRQPSSAPTASWGLRLYRRFSPPPLPVRSRWPWSRSTRSRSMASSAPESQPLSSPPTKSATMAPMPC